MGRSRWRPRSKRSRARIALLLAVLWFAGFEVLPWLHIATHEHIGKHHHDDSGAIIRDDEDDHDHDHDTNVAEHHHHHDDDIDDAIDEHAGDHDENAEVDEHGHHTHVHVSDDEDAEVDEHGAPIQAHRDHHPQSDPEKRLRDALAHGRHSLAHHDVATNSPPPVITAPLPVDRQLIFLFADTAIEPYSFSPGRAVARGPPSTCSS